MKHIPVLQKQVLKYLDPMPNQNFVDCTFGWGGHALSILKKIKPGGRVLGIEVDRELIEEFKKEHKEDLGLLLANGSYANLEKILEQNNFFPAHGFVFDLGMSSWHIEQSKRGFSFLRDEPLDMRYDLSNPLTAYQIVNTYSENDLREILEKYGEEKFARKIAKKIIEQRKIKPIKRAFDLTGIIQQSVPARFHRQRIHCATRAFQALRIAVNNELSNIEKGLFQAVKAVEKSGRVVVISFHSLEDRIVKNFFKNCKNIKILTKKPITPSLQEIKENKRARSAKLRAIIKE